MTNNLNAIGNVSKLPMLLEVDSVARKPVRRADDSTAAAARQEGRKQVEVGLRPCLPPAGKSKNPNYLAILAEAFVKAFDAMSEGAITQTKELAQMQQLDETMATCVLLSTKESIDQQDHMIKIEAQQAHTEKVSANTSTDVNITVWSVGGAVMLLTIASAVFDGGLSLAALPEEGEMMAVEMEPMAIEEVPEASIDLEGAASSVETESMTVTSATTDEAMDLEQTAQVDESIENVVDNGEEKPEEVPKWQKVLKGTAQLIINGAFGAPMLVTGIQSIIMSGILKQLAQVEKDVGKGIAKMQVTNMYFQFYQKLLQRMTGVTTEEVNEASQVVETFGKISNAYQQITYGLAQVV